jgi:hypothetical protein
MHSAPSEVTEGEGNPHRAYVEVPVIHRMTSQSTKPSGGLPTERPRDVKLKSALKCSTATRLTEPQDRLPVDGIGNFISSVSVYAELQIQLLHKKVVITIIGNKMSMELGRPRQGPPGNLMIPHYAFRNRLTRPIMVTSSEYTKRIEIQLPQMSRS